MEIFNIGPGELIFIIALMIILLGPVEMVRLARRAGELIRAIRQSSLWRDVRKLEQEAREFPVKLVREAGFEETMEELRQSTRISTDLKDPLQKKPGEVRSPEEGKDRPKGRLRPPQLYGYSAAIRTKPAEPDTEDGSSIEGGETKDSENTNPLGSKASD